MIVVASGLVLVGAVVGAGYGWGQIENAVADARWRLTVGVGQG